MRLNEISSKIKGRTTVRVKGKVDYSHIATKIDGEELERANSYTQFPSRSPYYKLAIEILDQNLINNFVYDKNDESQTYFTSYLASRIYESKKEENKGKKFLSLINKGNEMRVYKKDSAGKLHKVELNGNELAQGSEVEVEVIFFESKMGAGVGMNAVIICDDEIKTYQGNVGVTGYEMAEDTISLAPKAGSNAADVTSASAVADETAVGDAPEVDADPVGSSSAPSNDSFDALLAQFKAGGN